VCAPGSGPLADEIASAGIPVVTDLASLSQAPDLVHGHHTLPTIAALARFPDARGVFVCHDRSSPYAIPPRLPRIRRFVAVDENCLERLRDDWHIPESLTRLILNAVDMTRFPRRSPLPPRPQRALIFSHQASLATHEPVVRDACARRGIAVDIAGSSSGAVARAPEDVLGRYDLVFAKARCAIEAMAAGAAVVVCDAGGLGSLVTTREFERLRRWNFGARTLDRPLDVSFLLREIDRYHDEDAAAVTDRIRTEASLAGAMDQYERVYREVMEDAETPKTADVPAVVEPLLIRVARVEQELAGYRRPDRMRELSDEQVEAIRLTMDDVPTTMTAGVRGFAQVRIRNGTSVRLGAWPPFPLAWACRWRKASAREFPPHVGEHVLVTPPVEAGAEVSRAVAIVAPQEPGRYVLRITLVQEQLRWLDVAPTPVAADCEVEVRPSPGT